MVSAPVRHRLTRLSTGGLRGSDSDRTGRDRQRHRRSELFARNATGLVRGVSPRSSLIINFIPGHPAQSLAAGFFFALTLFPGGNYLLGLLLVIPMALAFSYAFGLLDQP